MRSEILRMFRDKDGKVATGSGDPRSNSVLLAELCKEIPLGETKSVRISVEIVGEKGEEKVGSKAVIERGPGSATGHLSIDGGTSRFWDSVTKDWQPGESRKVKSILFDTPSGVPVVEFCETPRERLKRAAEDASIKGSAVDAFGLLMAGVQDYLAATAGEGK